MAEVNIYCLSNMLLGVMGDTQEPKDEDAVGRDRIATYDEAVNRSAREDYGPAVWKFDDWMASLEEADEERHERTESDRLGSLIHTLDHAELEDAVQTTPGMTVGVQLLRPGEHAEKHRHNTPAINFVVKGSGYSIVDGEKLEWEQYDTFLAPPWDYHEHYNDGEEDAIIWTVQTMPLMYELRSQMWQEGEDADVVQQVIPRNE